MKGFDFVWICNLECRTNRSAFRNTLFELDKVSSSFVLVSLLFWIVAGHN